LIAKIIQIPNLISLYFAGLIEKKLKNNGVTSQPENDCSQY